MGRGRSWSWPPPAGSPEGAACRVGEARARGLLLRSCGHGDEEVRAGWREWGELLRASVVCGGDRWRLTDGWNRGEAVDLDREDPEGDLVSGASGGGATGQGGGFLGFAKMD